MSKSDVLEGGVILWKVGEIVKHLHRHMVGA